MNTGFERTGLLWSSGGHDERQPPIVEGFYQVPDTSCGQT